MLDIGIFATYRLAVAKVQFFLVGLQLNYRHGAAVVALTNE